MTETRSPDIIHFDDLVDRLPGNQPLAVALAGALTDDLFVQLGQYGDEELAALTGEVETQSSPWLTMLTAAQRQTAVAEGRLSLMRRSCAEFRDGALVDTAGHVEALLWARANPTGVATIDVEEGPDIAARILLYRSLPEVFLIELIGPLGFHDFVFANSTTVGTWLTRQAGVTENVNDEQLIEPDGAEALVDLITELRSTATRATSVLVHDQVGARHAVVYRTEQQNWLCEHLNPTDESVEVRLRTTGASHLARYLTHLIGPLT